MSFQHQPKIVTNGLVFYIDAANPECYPKDGSTCYDLIRKGTETFSGPVSFNSSQLGSFYLNANSYIELTDISAYSNTQPHTYCAWIKVQGFPGTYSWILNNGSGSNGTSLICYDSYAAIFFAGGSSYRFGNKPMVGHTWYYIVAAFNLLSVDFYMNGDFDVNKSIGGTWTAINENPRIGAWTNGGYLFSGWISNVQVYNRALTAAEVKQNYDALKSRYGL